MQPTFLIENNFDTKIICGIDEAGRGPLAGPVVACTFLVNREKILPKINDSKKISKSKRRKIFQDLIDNHKYGVGIVDNFQILAGTTDRIARAMPDDAVCNQRRG